MAQKVSSSLSGPAWQLAQSDPVALMRKASLNELNNSYGHHPLLRYQVRKITATSDTTKEIVESRDGGVARLIAVNDHSLSPDQQQAEIHRLHELDANPAIQAHRRRHEKRDADHLGEIMKLLPTAFLYQYAGAVQTATGPAIHLTFVPNPKFSPPDLEARILTGIRGDVWIDPSDERVVRISGNLFRSVDYGWGLLGVLSRGGRLLIVQSNTPSVGWQIASLVLQLRGKAVLIKTLRLNTTEDASDYHRVPSAWNYHDAVHWLLQQDSSGTPTRSTSEK